MDKCKYCANYLEGIERCKFCSFEYEERHTSDYWDIFELDWDMEIDKDIQYRLWAKGIECLMADIWWDNNMAYLLGCYASAESVAKALKIHQDCVYGNLDNGLIIINLFQEKCIRDGIELDED